MASLIIYHEKRFMSEEVKSIKEKFIHRFKTSLLISYEFSVDALNTFFVFKSSIMGLIKLLIVSSYFLSLIAILLQIPQAILGYLNICYPYFLRIVILSRKLRY